jgi:hypothetical protein
MTSTAGMRGSKIERERKRRRRRILRERPSMGWSLTDGQRLAG